MMKKLFFSLLVLIAIGANAQNGVTNDFRFGQGEDSVRCMKNLSTLSANIKNEHLYQDLYATWKELFDEFPVARVDTYTNGMKILNFFIKN